MKVSFFLKIILLVVCLLSFSIVVQNTSAASSTACFDEMLVSECLGSPSFVKAGLEKPFVVYTIPKCGSHLVATCLYLFTGKTQHFFPTWPIKTEEDCVHHLDIVGAKYYEMSHEYYNPQVRAWWDALQVKRVFVIRDPRDASISMANWILKGGVYGKNTQFYKWYSALSLNEQIRWVIKHVHGTGMAHMFNGRLGWMEGNESLVIRFEELVGSQGGGSRVLQCKTLSDLADFIGLDTTSQEIEKMADHVHGHPSSPTFHRGRLGMWKEIFDKETTTLAKQEFGELLILLGYEDSDNW